MYPTIGGGGRQIYLYLYLYNNPATGSPITTLLRLD